MLMNEYDAPESNNTYAGWESMVNIPAITGSFCKNLLSLSEVDLSRAAYRHLLLNNHPLDQMGVG